MVPSLLARPVPPWLVALVCLPGLSCLQAVVSQPNPGTPVPSTAWHTVGALKAPGALASELLAKLEVAAERGIPAGGGFPPSSFQVQGCQ